MRDRSRFVPVFILALFLVAGGATLFSPDSDAGSVCSASAISDGRTIPDIVGTWAGTWEDTVYYVSGAMTWTISVDERSDYIAYGTIDLSAIGLGVQEGFGYGDFITRDRQSLQINFEGSMVGLGSGILAGTSITGEGIVNAPLDFGIFTYQGAITDTAAIGRFFFNVGGAGRVVMTKNTPVEPSSWGSIKADYLDDDE